MPTAERCGKSYWQQVLVPLIVGLCGNCEVTKKWSRKQIPRDASRKQEIQVFAPIFGSAPQLDTIVPAGVILLHEAVIIS